MRDDATINDHIPLSMSCQLGVVSNDIIMNIWMSDIIRKVIIIRPLSGSFVRCLQINVPLLQIVLVCCCWPIINLQYRQFLMVDPASIGCNVYVLWSTSYTIHPTTHILCLDICLFFIMLSNAMDRLSPIHKLHPSSILLQFTSVIDRN